MGPTFARLKSSMARKKSSSQARALLQRDETRDVVTPVTLVIYGWYDSEPGTLAWVFPSVQAALLAVRAMRNAVRWIIVTGRRAIDGDVDVDALRRADGVLVEQAS